MREVTLIRRNAYGTEVGSLRARLCTNALERARGLLGRAPLPEGTALVLDPCRAIHTVGMRRAIDVVFCSGRGLVLRVLSAMPPGRFAIEPGASRVLELHAGEAVRLGIRIGDRFVLDANPASTRQPGTGVRRAGGAATVEFAVVALVLLPLVLGVLQLALLYSARHTLNYATFLAARAGAVDHGRRETMQRYLAKGLMPLHVRGDRALDVGSWSGAAAGAYARAWLEVRTPTITRLRVLNPTPASFADFARPGPAGPEIPDDPRLRTAAIGPTSGQRLADAALLQIRVDYCPRLVVPLVDRLLTGTLRRLDPDPFRQGCYAAGRLPMQARALVHAASPLRPS